MVHMRRVNFIDPLQHCLQQRIVVVPPGILLDIFSEYDATRSHNDQKKNAQDIGRLFPSQDGKVKSFLELSCPISIHLNSLTAVFDVFWVCDLDASVDNKKKEHILRLFRFAVHLRWNDKRQGLLRPTSRMSF